MQKFTIFGIGMLLALSLHLVSCNKNQTDPVTGEATLSLSMRTRSGGDDLVLGGDGSFSSLAVFLFDNTTGELEYAELIDDFSPAGTATTYARTVHVTQNTKAVYVIANYVGQSFSAAGLPVTLSASTPKSTLDALEVTTTAFSGDNIVMIGKEIVTMSGTSVSSSIEMERLVGRADLYVFKSAELAGDVVELVSVELHNQVNQSNVQYQNPAMPVGSIRQTGSYTAPASTFLPVVPSLTEFGEYTPDDATTSFYSFQNRSGHTDPATAVPDDNTTPFVLVKVKINGDMTVYRGDLQNTAGLYDLERNKVYRIKAVIGMPTDRLFVSVQVLGWETVLSEITYGDPAFTLAAQNSGASTGEISKTNPATYSFTLTGPTGTVWTAGLSNGLDFAFSAGSGQVSQGIARNAPYSVTVTPRKNYSGINRETKLWFVVEGAKAVINPAGAGGTFEDGRRYPGIDTEILIKQTH